MYIQIFTYKKWNSRSCLFEVTSVWVFGIRRPRLRIDTTCPKSDLRSHYQQSTGLLIPAICADAYIAGTLAFKSCHLSFAGWNRKRGIRKDAPFSMVEVTGFEPATSSSRTKRATKLRHTSIKQPRSTSGPMAAELGFEPRHTESESAVLPLHNSALHFYYYNQKNRYVKWFSHILFVIFIIPIS